MSNPISVFSIKGESSEKITLPVALFGGESNAQAMTQAVRVYLSNQRKAGAKTKTRSEISKTTAKMYKQKGTGRARHGSYSAPIFVGGGVAHGPTGEQNYSSKMSKKIKKLALISVFSEKAKDKKVVVIQTDKMEGKTKEGKNMLTMAGIAGTVLVVIGKGQEVIKRSFRNLEKVFVITSGEVNSYVVMKNKWLLMTKEALAEIVQLREGGK